MSKSFLARCCVMMFVIAILSSPAFPTDFEAIKNPKPNMREKEYSPLKKIKTIDADLGNGEYLFKPTSITVDSDNNIYVYDLFQAKIFKLDQNLGTVKKSFGSKGQGPGEFGGMGKGYPVFIKIGRDGKLYAHDTRMRKIIIFDLDGNYLTEYKSMVTNTYAPLVDSSGDLYIIDVKNLVINIYNQKKSPLYKLADQKKSFNFLFSTPGPDYLKIAAKYPAKELLTALSINSSFLLYFPSSSTMAILKNNKISKQMSIWPQEALTAYKPKLDKITKAAKNRYLSMFFHLFVDEDNADEFYLHFGRNEKKGINALYKFNCSGELLKVFYIKYQESSSFIRFELEKNDGFYAIEDDNLTLYKENTNSAN